MENSGCSPFVEYPEFYNNDYIRWIAQNKAWTVSDNKKRPLDMVSVLAGGPIIGAKHHDERCLVDLASIVRRIPTVTNHAYFQDADRDQCMIIDIEKTCPPDISDYLLSLPYYYRETSMSGKGYHIVVPLPDNFGDFPIAQDKLKLQDRSGDFEILLHHWVTFTRNPIPEEKCASARRPVDPDMAHFASIEGLYEYLASQAVESVRVDVDVVDEPEFDDPGFVDRLIEQIVRDFYHPKWGYKKGLSDFCGDHSRFEFGVQGYLLRRVLNKQNRIIQHDNYQTLMPVDGFSPEQLAWIIYRACDYIIDPREKHEEFRNGMPLLLNSAVQLVFKNVMEQENNNNDDDGGV